MISRDTFELNGRVFKVKYKYEKNIVWAITYVDGTEIKTHGTDEEAAFWAIQQRVYQHLNFRL